MMWMKPSGIFALFEEEHMNLSSRKGPRSNTSYDDSREQFIGEGSLGNARTPSSMPNIALLKAGIS